LAVGRHVAEEGGDGGAAGDPGGAVIRVGLPEPVGRERGQVAKARLVVLRGVQAALVAQRDEAHRQEHGAARKEGEQQQVDEKIGIDQARPPASCTGGATLRTSSTVVSPAPTLSAPLMRSAFMPSLNAMSRIAAMSARSFTRPLMPELKSSVSYMTDPTMKPGLAHTMPTTGL